jgi:hypothetical protein
LDRRSGADIVHDLFPGAGEISAQAGLMQLHQDQA